MWGTRLKTWPTVSYPVLEISQRAGQPPHQPGGDLCGKQKPGSSANSKHPAGDPLARRGDIGHVTDAIQPSQASVPTLRGAPSYSAAHHDGRHFHQRRDRGQEV